MRGPRGAGPRGVPARAWEPGTHQNGAVDLVAVRFHLGIGYRVVIQHSLQICPVGGQVWVQDAFHGLEEKGRQRAALWLIASNALSQESPTFIPDAGQGSILLNSPRGILNQHLFGTSSCTSFPEPWRLRLCTKTQ